MSASVTVCIPVHNDAIEAERALESVLGQTVPPFEVIVVDDGSDSPFAWFDPDIPVRVVRVTNRGLPAARNTGLMLAQGAWFLPLDADDTIAPDYLEKTLAEAERSGADVVLTGIQEHGPTRNGTYRPGYDRPWHEVTWRLLADGYNRFYYCSLMRTQMLREVGGYNTRMAGWPGHTAAGYEDWDLWIDLLRRGVKFAAVDEPLFHYSTDPAGSMWVDAERDRAKLVAEIRRHHRLDSPVGAVR